MFGFCILMENGYNYNPDVKIINLLSFLIFVFAIKKQIVVNEFSSLKRPRFFQTNPKILVVFVLIGIFSKQVITK